MKNIICTIFYIAFGLLSTHIQAQQFIKVNGTATDIAINPRDGKVYIISNKNMFYDYNAKTKKWKLFGNRTNAMKSVSVNAAGQVYMVSTSSGDVNQWNGSWKRLSGLSTDEVVCVQNSSSIFAINNYANKVKQLNINPVLGKSGNWVDPNGHVNTINGLKQILVTNAGQFYARNLDNNFITYKGGRWNTLNGSPLQIALDHKTGIVYAVGRNKGIYKWNSRSKKWLLLDGTRKDFKTLAVHNGKIWATTTNNSIYYYDSDRRTATPNTDYAGTYRVTFTKILRGDNSQWRHDFYGTIGVRLHAYGGTKITINPKSERPFRVLDIPKNNLAKFRKLNSTLTTKKFIHFDKDGPYKPNEYFKGYFYHYPIDIMREFVLGGNNANNRAVFNFQFNLKEVNSFLQHVGQWEQLNIPIGEVELGREYIYSSKHNTNGRNNGICFKIEKL